MTASAQQKTRAMFELGVAIRILWEVRDDLELEADHESVLRLAGNELTALRNKLRSELGMPT